MLDRAYEPNQAEIRRLLLSTDVQAPCVDVAERGRRLAVSMSPADSGRFRDNWRVTRERFAWPGGDRAGARLTNSTDYARTLNRGGRGRRPLNITDRVAAALREGS